MSGLQTFEDLARKCHYEYSASLRSDNQWLAVGRKTDEIDDIGDLWECPIGAGIHNPPIMYRDGAKTGGRRYENLIVLSDWKGNPGVCIPCEDDFTGIEGNDFRAIDGVFD